MTLKIQLCFTGINYILKYIKIENFYFKLQKYFTILFCEIIFCIFYQIDTALISLRNFLKNFTDPKLLNSSVLYCKNVFSGNLKCTSFSYIKGQIKYK